MNDSTKVKIIAGLWGAAVGTGVYYVQTVISERKKRKAIDKWEAEELEKIRSDRKEKSLLERGFYTYEEAFENTES